MMFCIELIFASYPSKKWGRKLFRKDIQMLFEQDYPERKELPHIIRYDEKTDKWYVYQLSEE